MIIFRKNLHSFIRNRKKVKSLLIAVLILIAIPLTVFLALHEQSLNTKAGPGNADLSIAPSSKTHNVGDTSTVDVFLNPNDENVAAVELVINYNPAVIQVTGITPGAFFTDETATVGNPIEIIKTFTNGQIHYAVGFPLGSNHGSTAAKNVAQVSYTVLSSATGTSNLDFVISGNPKTTISDTTAQNVLGNVFNGSINIGSGARLFFGNLTPQNPQNLGFPLTMDVLVDTGGQDIDGVDARISFDPAVLKVTNLQQGTEPSLPAYPLLEYDNTAGTVYISANIGSGGSTPPANGSNLKIGTITFTSLQISSNTQVVYNFIPGDRNDSNIVLSGTSQSGDPQDILSSVTNMDIIIVPSISITPTPTATSTPIPTATNTPIPTATPTTSRTTPTPTPVITSTPTPLPTATNTPIPTATNTPTSTPIATNTPTATPVPPKTVTLALTFQGTTRIGSGFPKVLNISYQTVGGPVIGPESFNVNANGQGLFSFMPGNYIMLIKAPGYLARLFGSSTNPLIINTTISTLDLTLNPLLGGDFNGDGVINEVDYSSKFLPAFLENDSLVDLDGSGQVNNLDFGIMRSNWGLEDDIL